MGKKVNDSAFIKMLKEVQSGYWDIQNFNFNSGSEYTVTFAMALEKDVKERIRISARMAKALSTFGLTEMERRADEEYDDGLSYGHTRVTSDLRSVVAAKR
jgi:hypothetical protein